MKVSAEIRWFWSSEPLAIAHWFQTGPPKHTFKAGGGAGAPRRDEYLADAAQLELGIKQRGITATNQKQPSGPEIKGLVDAHCGDSSASPFNGPIELWAKWESKILKLPEKRIVTKKTRWLRKFDTSKSPPCEIALDGKEDPTNEDEGLPDDGCNAEFTKVEVDGETWWTFGLESFGKIATLKDSLVAVAAELSKRGPPSFDGATVKSYPQWLASLESPGPRSRRTPE